MTSLKGESHDMVMAYPHLQSFHEKNNFKMSI